MKLLAKIAVAKVIGKVPTETVKVPKMENGNVVLDSNNQAVMVDAQRAIKQPLIRVIGICTGFKKANTAYGEAIGFKGEFQATSMIDGEISRGPMLYLPNVATDIMFPVVEAAKGNPVEFGFDIGVVPANTPHGYEYTISPLVQTAVSDPLAQLASRLGDTPLPEGAKVLAIANANEATSENAAETKTEEAPKQTTKKK